MRSLIVSILLFTVATAAAQSPTRVVGRVLDAQTNEPLAGAMIILTRVNPGQPPNPLAVPLRIQTNSDGTFNLNVPPARYRIDLQRQGFVSVTVHSAASPLAIDGAGEAVNLGDIRLARGGVIEGRIVDEKGRPLPGVAVSAVRLPPDSLRAAVPGLVVGGAVPTNDLGEFRLSGVPGGRYYVMARPATRLPTGGEQVAVGPAFVSTFYPGFADIAAASLVDVTAGSTTNGIAFQMLQAPTVIVSGIVVDGEERPVPGAVVSFQPARDVPGAPLMVLTLSNGRFQIALPDGDYLAAAAIPVVVATGTNRSAAVNVQTGGPGSIKVTVEGRPISGVKLVGVR